MANPVLDDLLATARALLAAVVQDDSGQMIGTQWVGGNGGLLSRETLRVADQLRLALDAYDNPGRPETGEAEQ